MCIVMCSAIQNEKGDYFSMQPKNANIPIEMVLPLELDDGQVIRVHLNRETLLLLHHRILAAMRKINSCPGSSRIELKEVH